MLQHKIHIIPKNVKELSIGKKMVYGCKSFNKFDLTEAENLNVLIVGDSAFESTSLENIIIPKNMRWLYIGNKAFFKCVKLHLERR